MNKITEFIIIVGFIMCTIGFEDYFLFHNFDDDRVPIILFMIGTIFVFVGFWIYIHLLISVLSPVVC